LEAEHAKERGPVCCISSELIYQWLMLEKEVSKDQEQEGTSLSQFKWVNLAIYSVGTRDAEKPSTGWKQKVQFHLG
jgi:hypothetical protein